MKEETLFEKRLIDLSSQAFRQGRYTFSNFLDQYEQSLLLAMSNRLEESNWKLFGGYEGAERRMVRFGSAQELGYEQDFPLSLVHVKVLGGRFAKKLNHRDYLGALMHLGIERNLIGDILVMEQEAYVFVKDAIGPFLMQEWTRVGPLLICLNEMPLQDFDYTPSFEEIKGFCPSFRADVMVSFLCRTSRKESSDLMKGQKVFVNGALVTNNSYLLKEGDILSVRGYGKAIFSQVTGQSKKGRYAVCMKKYV